MITTDKNNKRFLLFLCLILILLFLLKCCSREEYREVPGIEQIDSVEEDSSKVSDEPEETPEGKPPVDDPPNEPDSPHNDSPNEPNPPHNDPPNEPNPPPNEPNPPPNEPNPPHDYDKKTLAKDLRRFAPNLPPYQGKKLKEKLKNAFNSNAVILGDFSDGTDKYKLEDYLVHLKTTGPYDIEIHNIVKDREGRLTLIELKETQINKSNLPSKPLEPPFPNPIPPPTKKSLADDFMQLTPKLKRSEVVELDEKFQYIFSRNATISGEFSDGTSQYKLKNYIIHLRTTGPYNVEVYEMKKNKEGKILSIKLRETQVDQ